MKKAVTMFLVLILISLIGGTTIEVNIDGSGDYMTIQEGIDASSDGDVVLVYPGRYYEHINYNGKTITVASLNYTTGEEHYIDETIIDGSDNGSCVRVGSGEGAMTKLQGLTITNGAGDLTHVNYRSGGGILLLEYSHLRVKNCVITRNRASKGGGIHAANSYLILEGTTICYNISTQIYSGGLTTIRMSEVTFSETNRCNIYNNYGYYANDVCNNIDSGGGVEYTVIVDTFTVLEPDIYYLIGIDHLPEDYFVMEYDIQHSYVETAEYNIYVAPEGDNLNSGISADEPMQSITEALIRIQADAENPRTIHLAPGLYSPSANGQILPLQLKSYVSLEGAGIYETIIDGEDYNNMLYDIHSSYGYAVRNLSFENAFSPSGIEPFAFPICCHFSKINDNLEYLLLENVRFAYCGDGSDPGENNYYLIWTDGWLDLNNVIFEDNESRMYGLSLWGANSQEEPQIFNISNCVMRNNENFIGLGYDSNGNEDNQVNIINMEYTGNHYYYPGATPGNIYDHGMFFLEDGQINIINCTFSENTVSQDDGSVLGFYNTMNINILNTIISGYPYYAIKRRLNNGQEPQTFLLDHCLIEGGYDDIFGALFPELIYGEVLEGDPQFTENGEYPYYLSNYSPLIGAGTLDLPEGINLPEYDFMGNPRILGNGIDIGAYEWNGFSTNIIDDVIEFHNLSVYPNPFNPTTTISFYTAEESKISELQIYNFKGQKVKTLVDGILPKGEHSVIWHAEDTSSGIYFIKYKNGSVKVIKRVSLLK